MGYSVNVYEIYSLFTMDAKVLYLIEWDGLVLRGPFIWRFVTLEKDTCKLQFCLAKINQQCLQYTLFHDLKMWSSTPTPEVGVKKKHFKIRQCHTTKRHCQIPI